MLPIHETPEDPSTTRGSRPLLELLPRLASEVPFVALGRFPTPIERLTFAEAPSHEVFVKRDDVSASHYGGNKVRTLEVLFALALRDGFTRVVSTGAFGSNHAVATVLHAPRVGLTSGALLFPQPHSGCALENLERSASYANELVTLRHVTLLPTGMWRWRRRARSEAFVMPPGGATPWGALGYVSAALELAEQIRAGQLPTPERIVLPIGSTCTSAGLLVGLRVARRLGLAFREKLPEVHAVRVSPWPVTSPWRVALLAKHTSELLAHWSGESRFAFELRELRAGLRVDQRFLGPGYGRVTPSGLAAMTQLGAFGRTLDTTYSAKAGAGLYRIACEQPGPSLLWATKSSAPLPPPYPERLATLPDWVQRWIQDARRGALP